MRKQTAASKRPDQTRYTAALTLTGRTLPQVARDAGLSRGYLREVLIGTRGLSARARDVLRAAVGAAGWKYALGESDVLPAGDGSQGVAA